MVKKLFLKKNFLGPKSLKNVILGPKIVKEWLSQKNLVENLFWSESIQNVLKRILKRKSQNRKCFPIRNFFWDFVIFSSLWTVHRKFEKN